MLRDRSHEESQNVNFVQNHSVATVNSLMLTPVLLMDVSQLKMSLCIFYYPFGVSAYIHHAANFEKV